MCIRDRGHTPLTPHPFVLSLSKPVLSLTKGTPRPTHPGTGSPAKNYDQPTRFQIFRTRKAFQPACPSVSRAGLAFPPSVFLPASSLGPKARTGRLTSLPTPDHLQSSRAGCLPAGLPKSLGPDWGTHSRKASDTGITLALPYAKYRPVNCTIDG